jgi:hypothetical protein
MTQAIYDPAYRLEDLERLELLDFDWQDVHYLVQSVLCSIDESVKSLNPDCRIADGHNSSGAWELFSYRVYAPPPMSDIDPVVVGVSFAIAANGAITVHGDIVGETIGDILFELPRQETSENSRLMETARDVSRILAQRQSQIVKALTDPVRQT